MKNLSKLIFGVFVISLFLVFFGCVNQQPIGDKNLVDLNSSSVDNNLTVDKNSSTYSNLESLFRAKTGNTVTVHYVGSYENGTIFDSSVDRNQPITFVVGSGQMIEGFDEAVVGMKVGDKKTVIIPPEKAYGVESTNVYYVDSNMFDTNKLDVGMIFRESINGYIIKVVEVVNDRNVGVTVNNSKAGQTLIFDIEMLNIK
ncbi:MAG: peptidylprolyl isomerase [Candidatus ainarchaeum sp.]|nr:peptidylprolyl isomerase [Candidatus ainarchaeum sp.]